MRRLVIIVWLTLVWVTLWEELSSANVIGGLVVAGVIVVVIPPMSGGSTVGFRPLRAIKLLVYFLWELLEASALMAWEVVTPRNRVNAAVVSIELTSRVIGVVTAVANMVSLTPGTLTLEVDEETMTLFIHVLHLESVQETRDSVLQLERLTLDAFPPRGDETHQVRITEGSS